MNELLEKQLDGSMMNNLFLLEYSYQLLSFMVEHKSYYRANDLANAYMGYISGIVIHYNLLMLYDYLNKNE